MLPAASQARGNRLFPYAQEQNGCLAAGDLTSRLWKLIIPLEFPKFTGRFLAMPAAQRTPKPSLAQSAARERLLAAARQNFFAHGFRGVTMDELAASLGMSKKTLYAHFPSKTELLKALVAQKFAEVEADLSQITAARAADVMPALRELLAAVQRNTQEIQPAFFRDVQRLEPEVFAWAENRRRQLIEQHFSKLLTAGRRWGVIRKDIPVKLVIEIILGAAHAMLTPRAMAELAITPRTGLSAIITVVLEGRDH